MRVVSVPCLKDNFAYLVVDNGQAAVVDPGEAPPITEALAREGVKLSAIWATHHHADHVGGIEELVAANPGAAVLAGERDAPKIKGVTQRLADAEQFTFGSLRVRTIHNPGHTLGAISFVVEDCVFTGDTLFGAGCGRMFEGDPAMFYGSLSKLAALPSATRVFFGHEYTAANLRFAAAVEPDNHDITTRAATIPEPSTPSTIGLERATNPFLRCATPNVATAAIGRGSHNDPISVFGAIRSWKDQFRG